MAGTSNEPKVQEVVFTRDELTDMYRRAADSVGRAAKTYIDTCEDCFSDNAIVAEMETMSGNAVLVCENCWTEYHGGRPRFMGLALHNMRLALYGFIEMSVYQRLKKTGTSQEWHEISQGLQNGEIQVSIEQPPRERTLT